MREGVVSVGGEAFKLKDFKYITEDGLVRMHNPDCFVPEHNAGGIIRYVEFGIDPGSFLSALIDNDLSNAVVCADGVNSRHIASIVKWFFNYAPSPCWGHPGARNDWKLFLEKRAEK